jgi:hypothetical protein
METMKTPSFMIIGEEHVRQNLIEAFGQLWWVNECIGPEDVGKRLVKKAPKTLVNLCHFTSAGGAFEAVSGNRLDIHVSKRSPVEGGEGC